MKCEDRYGDLLIRLEKLAKQMTNEKRQAKALLFIEMLLYLFLEDEKTNAFFEDARSDK